MFLVVYLTVRQTTVTKRIKKRYISFQVLVCIFLYYFDRPTGWMFNTFKHFNMKQQLQFLSSSLQMDRWCLLRVIARLFLLCCCRFGVTSPRAELGMQRKGMSRHLNRPASSEWPSWRCQIPLCLRMCWVSNTRANKWGFPRGLSVKMGLPSPRCSLQIWRRLLLAPARDQGKIQQYQCRRRALPAPGQSLHCLQNGHSNYSPVEIINNSHYDERKDMQFVLWTHSVYWNTKEH